jgi:hypothetical protein
VLLYKSVSTLGNSYELNMLDRQCVLSLNVDHIKVDSVGALQGLFHDPDHPYSAAFT